MMNPAHLTHWLALASLAIVAAPVVALTAAVGRTLRHPARDALSSRAGLGTFVCGLALLATLLLRPAENTFSGLDISAYRLMAASLAAGRPLKGPDAALRALPRPLRSLVLYRPETHKTTRDESFLIESMETCATRPFFYPLLPLAMVGFDLIVPGEARDYFMPVLGLWFCALLLACGIARGGALGGVGALALLLATPFPAWFFRGCFPESVGTILLAASVLSWCLRAPAEAGEPADGRPVGVSPWHAFALGLAISYHPVMLVLAVPAVGILLVSEVRRGARVTLTHSAAFALGVLPLLLMTRYITAPYGTLSWNTLVRGLRYSTAMRVTAVATALLGAAAVGAVCAGRRLTAAVATLAARAPRTAAAGLGAVWLAPTALAVLPWSNAAMARQGLRELIDGLRLPLIAAVTGLWLWSALARSRRHGRLRIALTPAFLVLPVFLVLKGWDQVGLWSQRRLLPFVIVLLAISVPAMADAARAAADARGTARRRGTVAWLAAALAIVAFANAVRWPAPYLVRDERGADALTRDVAAHLDSRITFVDYHGYSVPLAVMTSPPVYGLGPYAEDRLGELCAYIAGHASTTNFLWLTAYANPGLEDGVVLTSTGMRSAELPRVNAKSALPAVRAVKRVALEALGVSPAGETPLAVDKTLDRGPLALRPPWGRRDRTLRTPDGRDVCAGWSREGSGIVGPIPRPGRNVRITIEGAASRADGRADQVLCVVPPWGDAGESPVRMTLGNTWSVARAVAAGPATNAAARTGVYRLYAETPYDPAVAGTRGYAPDLGALIHRIRIEECAAVETPPDRP